MGWQNRVKANTAPPLLRYQGVIHHVLFLTIYRKLLCSPSGTKTEVLFSWGFEDEGRIRSALLLSSLKDWQTYISWFGISSTTQTNITKQQQQHQKSSLQLLLNRKLISHDKMLTRTPCQRSTEAQSWGWTSGDVIEFAI